MLKSLNSLVSTLELWAKASNIYILIIIYLLSKHNHSKIIYYIPWIINQVLLFQTYLEQFDHYDHKNNP